MKQAANLLITKPVYTKNLKDKFDGIQNQIQSLEALGERQAGYDEKIANDVLRFFPQEITKKWRVSWTVQVRPTLLMVLTVLGAEIRVVESEEALRSGEEKKKQIQTNATRILRGRSTMPVAEHASCATFRRTKLQCAIKEPPKSGKPD